MRFPTLILALGAAATATPATAQLLGGLGGQGGIGANIGAGVGANAGAGANVGSAVKGVTGRLGNTVDRVDRTANDAVNGAFGAELTATTAADLQSGAVVRDKNGKSIGVVQAVHGDAALVAKGGQSMHIPLSELYRNSSGLVTTLTKAELKAAASAQASANAGATARN